MPEGDSVAGHAQRLRPLLVSHRVVEVGGTAPSVRANSRRMLDADVDGIRTSGKNLVIDFSTGYSARIHLGMSGRWQVGPVVRTVHGSARLILATTSHRVACHAAPTVEVDRTPTIDDELARLGPDLLGDFEVAEFLRRARIANDTSLAEMLMDQRVLAGIGNVYKSELLFLAGIHPDTSTSEVSDAQLRAMAAEAKRLLASNVGSLRRSTTGSHARGQETWVYGQAGMGCRLCGTRVERGSHGGRVTYWCPRCQARLGVGDPPQ